MADKLQLMLINVLIDQLFNTKVSQGSVATRLRCDGIFNDQLITQSLLSPKVKKKLKIGQHLPKLWAIKYRVVFYETRCTTVVRLRQLLRVVYCRALPLSGVFRPKIASPPELPGPPSRHNFVTICSVGKQNDGHISYGTKRSTICTIVTSQYRHWTDRHKR